MTSLETDADARMEDLRISDMECPVCCEVYTEPKLLGCGHLVCRTCLVTWLRVRGMEAGCPLCRYPILEMWQMHKPCMQPENVADCLPTDFLVQLVAGSSGRDDDVLRPSGRGQGEQPSGTCLSGREPCPTEEILRKHPDDAPTVSLADKLRDLVALTMDLKGFLKDKEKEYRNADMHTPQLVAVGTKGWQAVVLFQDQADQHHTVLITHQHLLDRIQGSSRCLVEAAVRMKTAMQQRVDLLERKTHHLLQTVFRCVLFRFPVISERRRGLQR